ncbi:MAG: ATP-binding protein [Candidatus Schekmanbacteria bacterium]|nr:ATP-binding protein [Candidatus Schekmanbacteria bacterium]
MPITTPWRQIVTPHDNIRQGRVKQNDFAASLADVLHHRGNADYYDPVRFLNRTFLTAGLRQLAGEVVGRLTGQGDGDAVMQIQTPFGGGKTHTLITLYHLVRNGRACFDHPALSAYWLGRGWKVPPSVAVAAFDGNQVGVGAVEVEPGLSVQTMWGHLAWQLAGRAGYELMRNFDANRVSPSGEDIDRVLEAAGGGLIILDEVASYVETAAAVAVHDSTLAAQTRTFLQRLATRAGHHERVILVATLPRSDGTQTHGMASLQVLQALQELFGRVQKVREPVAGDEVHEIIRRRLFVPFGQDTEDKGTRTRKGKNRDATIHAYVADLKTRPQVPDFAKEHTYAERFRQSYPFHPYLLDVINRYVGANPKFQRTRGVLRILALVVADLLKNNHNGGLIQASDIDLTNEEIRSEVLELVDREFRSALEADIIGGGANAIDLDRQSPQMTQWHIAAGLAATTFLFTCEAGNGSRGATLAELHLASARPEIDFGTIPGVVLQMKERFHFINTEGERFRFSTTPNLNRILLDAKNGVDDEQARERLEAEIRKLLSQAPLSPYIWPEGPGDIADSASNKLVVMPPERAFGPASRAETQAAVLDILNKSGSTHRTRRNTLVFLIADEGEVALLKERVRSLLAAENVDTNRERHNLSKTQVTQLQTEKTNAAKGVRQQILRAYRHTAWGGSNGDPLKAMDMGQPPATTDQNLTDLVVAFLREKQKYLEQIASILLVHPTKLQVWPEDEPALRLKALPGYFRSFTHLPILKDDEVLKQSIADGVRAGHFALCEGTSAADAKVLHYKTSLTTTGVALDDGYLLVRPALAEQKLQEEKARVVGGTSVVTVTPTPPTGVAQPPSGTGPAPVAPAGGMGAGGATITTTPTGTKPSTGKDGRPRRVRLDVEVPFTDFHTFYTGIINALGRNADKIEIRVQVEASAAAGFSPTLIEDTVKETLFNLFHTDDLLTVAED